MCRFCRYELWRLGDLRLITRAKVRGALPPNLATGTPQQGVQVPALPPWRALKNRSPTSSPAGHELL